MNNFLYVKRYIVVQYDPRHAGCDNDGHRPKHEFGSTYEVRRIMEQAGIWAQRPRVATTMARWVDDPYFG